MIEIIGKKGEHDIMGETYLEMGDLVSNFADTICIQVRETQDEIVFSTISNFLKREFNDITVSKSELIQAIRLLRNYKERGFDISERWVTATQQTNALNMEYNRGVRDGIKKERDRIESILKEEER